MKIDHILKAQRAQMRRCGRRFTFRCSTCGAQARARELIGHATQWTPRCPKGHGEMTRVPIRLKFPDRKRKARWSWFNGERVK